MDLGFNEPVNPHIDPKIVVEDILHRILNLRDKLKLPIMGFVEAPARLQRQGVTFLVKIFDGDAMEDVPLRVENETVVRTRYFKKEHLGSWRGRVIHSVTVHVRHTVGELIKKISKHLRVSLHRFQHKLQKRICTNRKRHTREARRNFRSQHFAPVH